VAQRVVDLFEAVKIEKRHGQAPLITLRFADTLTQPFAEHAAIRKPGEAVVIGQVFHALGVREFRFPLSRSPLHQLPAHAAQQAREHHHEEAPKGRPPQGDTPLALRAGHLLIHRDTDEDGERKPVELAGIGPTRHPIPAAGCHSGLLAVILSPRHHRGIVDRIPGDHRIAGAHDPKNAVGAEKPEHTVLTQLRRLVAAHEIVRIDGDDHYAVKRSV